MSNKAQHPLGDVIRLQPLPADDPNREPTVQELADLMALPKPSWEELERLGREQQQQQQAQPPAARSQEQGRGIEQSL